VDVGGKYANLSRLPLLPPPRLLQTTWARSLDSTPGELITLATQAKRMGLLDLSQAGGVVEFSFRRILTPEERDLVYGTY